MNERINAPQGVPIEGTVHALGDMAAAGAQADSTPTKASSKTPEIAPFPDTTLNKREYLQQYERWVSGGSAESAATDIAHIALEPKEQFILDGVDILYTTLNTADVLGHAMSSARLLLPKEIELVQKYAHLFMGVVRKDGQQSGIGQPDIRDLVIQCGGFMPAVSDFTHGETWHVDAHQQPTVRYVMAFGSAGSTRFAHGILEPHDVTRLGTVRNPQEIQRSEAWQVRQPWPGTVTRFPARFGVHSTPQDSGNRLFFSASIYPNYRPQ